MAIDFIYKLINLKYTLKNESANTFVKLVLYTHANSLVIIPTVLNIKYVSIFVQQKPKRNDSSIFFSE